MARFLLFHAPDADALLRHAAEPLLAPHSDAPPPLLAVRQGGVRDDVVAALASGARDGWLGSPVVVFRELLEQIAGDAAPLSVFEREVLLRSAIRTTGAFPGLRSLGGFVGALDRLFGRLRAERVSPDRFAGTLRGALGHEADGWARERDRQLAALYAEWNGALAALGPLDGVARCDGRDLAAIAAEAVRDEPDAVARRLRAPFSAAGRASLAVYGLADLGGGWGLLLQALRAAPFIDELRVYLAAPTTTGGARGDLSELTLLDALRERADDVVALPGSPRSGALARLRDDLFGDVEPAEASAAAGGHAPLPREAAVVALAAPDLARTLQAVARVVKRRIHDGARPDEIAVVVRGLRPDGPRAVQELRRHGIPVTARLRYRLAEIPVIAAVLRVVRLGAEGWSRRALIEVAESPYFDLHLDAGVFAHIAARGRPRTLDEWRGAVAALLVEATAAEEIAEDDGGDAGRRYHGPAAERVRAALQAFEPLMREAPALESAHRRSEWIGLCLDYLGAGDLPGEERPGLWGLARAAARLHARHESDEERVQAVRLDVAALRTARDLLAAWRRALRLDRTEDAELDPAAWLRELAATLEEGELAAWTPQRHGVQVLEALAAVGRTFEHVHLVGLAAGEFPVEPPRGGLFTDAETETLRAAGLPLEPAQEWLAREASLFRAVATGARRSLHLSYASADAAGTPRLPSPYLEEVAALLRPGEADPLDHWLERVPGSRLAPASIDDVWCADDALLFGARAWRDGAGATAEDDVLRPPGASAPALAALRGAWEVEGDVVRRALHGARVEWLRAGHRRSPALSRVPHAYDGAIDDPDLRAWLEARYGDAVWSASRLERYGFCPFTFFGADVLRLAAIEEPEEEIDAATRGTVYHAALERLHREMAAGFGEEALDATRVEAAVARLPTILDDVLAEQAARAWTGEEALVGVLRDHMRRALEAYVRWEAAENGASGWRRVPRRQPVAFELVFGRDGEPPVEITDGERVLRLRGRIDRVDELIEDGVRGWLYVVDHKSGGGSLEPHSKYESGALLQLPLYLHALGRIRPGAQVWGGSYQVIAPRPARPAARLHPRNILKDGVKEGGSAERDRAAERISRAPERALDIADAIRAGRFPAAIPPRCTCPPWCEFIEICREDRVERR